MQQRCETVGRSANFRVIKESSGDINRLHMQATRYPNLSAATWTTPCARSSRRSPASWLRRDTDRFGHDRSVAEVIEAGLPVVVPFEQLRQRAQTAVKSSRENSGHHV
jgi:hypothetical protein